MPEPKSNLTELKTEKSLFQTLYDIDVSPHVQTLTISGRTMEYLEWATAWRLAKEVDPKATFKIHWPDERTPYFPTPCGVFVHCEVTVKGTTADDVYSLDKPDPTSFDITNAHQRCLVKCLGRLGLGLKLWETQEREKLTTTPPGEYTMGISKNNSYGLTLNEMGYDLVLKDYGYWTSRIRAEGKPATGEVKRFIENAKVWLDAFTKTQSKESKELDIPF